MNRDIKFKVWNGRKMILPDDPFMVIRLNGEITGTCFGELDGPEPSSTLLQFTGLKDENGKEIYEGDIVKIKRCFTRPVVKNGQIDYNFIEGDEEIGQVMYLWDGSLTVCYEHIRSDDFDKDILHVKHRVEVIGNIHENPELL